MKFGVRIPCYRRWCRSEQVRAIATTAEDLGFDSLWVQDHVVAPVGPPAEMQVEGVSDWMSATLSATVEPRKPMTVSEYYAGDDWWLDPYATWGFLAAVTHRVRLASDIVVIPYRNPVIQAKMLGTLDVLSNGRMMLGTGSGHVPAEFRTLGLDFAARGRMHDEYLRIIRLLLTEEEAGFEGEFFSFDRVRPLIRAVQQPHPPIYVGGNGKRSIRRAVELGDGWLPSATDPDGLARGLVALHAACDAAGRTDLPVVAVSLPSMLQMAVPGVPAGRQRSYTGDEAVAELRRYEAIGVDEVALGFPMPNETVYLQQIGYFASEVLPAFR